MEKVNLASLTLDDIVFENRNRAYGAYAIRAAYERNMTRALTMAPLLLLLLVGGPMLVNNLLQSLIPPVIFLNPTDPPLVFTDKNDLIIIPEKKFTPPASTPQVKTIRNVPLVAVKDNEVNPNDQPATVDQLQTAISGPLTVDGIDADVPPVDVAISTGEGTGAPVEAAAPPTEFLVVEEMPEFPGGQAAMLKFIGKHLRYPASARNQGLSGVVYVSFVISPEGQVTKVEVLKGINAACDQEAARVISQMPAWKPGRQSGRNVPVRYSLPIRFSMQ